MLVDVSGLDAVPPQHVLQAADLVAQPVEFPAQGHDIGTCRPLRDQPFPVGQQLLLAGAQGGGAVQFLRVDRRVLFLPCLGDPQVVVADSGRNAFIAGLCALGQQPEDLVPDPGVVGAEPGQDLECDPVTLFDQAEREAGVTATPPGRWPEGGPPLAR